MHLRNALLSKHTNDINQFNLPPKLLVKEGFAVDSPTVRSKYHSTIKKQIRAFQKIDFKGAHTEDQVKDIVLSFSKNGGPGCGDFQNIVHKIESLSAKSGQGCCSDHSEVFIALATINGIETREVHNSRHTFNEYYNEELGKWIWVDPQYAIMARDQHGELLSLSQIRQMYFFEKKVLYDFFGNQYHEFSTSSPYEHEYYDNSDDFSFMMLTLGNNVFEYDLLTEQYSFLPKIVRQSIFMVIGLQPSYLIYSDTNTTWSFKFEQVKMATFTYIFVFFTLNVILAIHSTRRKYSIECDVDKNYSKY